MKSIFMFCILCVFFLLPLHCANADMGQVLVSDAQVSESAQKAIILHNGSEEVLILGTDLLADTKVGILRFIPFPSEPQVKLAPDGVFETVSGLLATHGISFLMATKGGAPQAQAVELLVQEKLGAHDMTVIKVNNATQFRSWVNDYFKSHNLPAKETYSSVETIVDDYVQRGIPYFVLDYVELSDQPRFIEPVCYRFASHDLYYPLKTSNTFGGQGEIDLILFLPGTLCKPSLGAYDTCLGFTNYVDNGRASTSAQVSHDELRSIYPEAEEFFGERPVFLQMFSYAGDYTFDRDILEEIGGAAPMALGLETEPVYGLFPPD
ncbi:MAG: DUF2330 domain-containing protein, partial [Proteobacteria bacterium]|nr:DUF2330 domain-containing protein [Pseudomonadota bacterium]